MTTLVARAYAKVNLELRLLGRRPDGYHELRTIYQALSLHDTLTIRAVTGAFRLESSARGLACDASNLIWRAADALWHAAGRRGPVRGVAIHARKRIPIQAGLGGGSSDAAATLLALRALWRLRLPRRDLVSVAASIGSDVPFFLSGGTALGLGRGEQVYPLPDAGHWQVVLVQPDVGVPTADAYAWHVADADLARTGSADRSRHAELPVRWGPGALRLANDLEDPVCRRLPAVGRLTCALRDAGAEVALMAGSGSTVFGLFSSRRAAAGAASRLVRQDRFVVVTRFVARREYAAGILSGRSPRLPRVLPIG